MESLAESSERIAGKAAAQKLLDSWPEAGHQPLDPTAEWAEAAIEELGAAYRRAPTMIRAALNGAQTAAASLSPRPFQGILECLQNADDLGATELRVTVRREPRRELLIAHDGKPVSLADAAAMSLPWLSTKRGDAQSSGRFGIGQQTLRALGDTIEVHSPPFHFELQDDGPRVACAGEGIRSTYNPEARETIVAVPLREAIDDGDVADAVANLGVRCLIFLRTVRRLIFRDVERPERDTSFALRVQESETISLVVDGVTRDVEHVILRAFEPPASIDGFYERYWMQQAVREGPSRLNKATGETTPIGISICANGADEASLYDRVPLPVKLGFPISLNAQFDPDSARTTILKKPWNDDRIVDLGRLVSSTALHAFEQAPIKAWHHVPLRSEQNVPDWLGAMLEANVVNECHRSLVDGLSLATDSGPKLLSQIVYPAESIEALLTIADQRLLDPGRFVLSESSRDSAGRWRKVLAELGASRRLDVADCLELFDHPDHLAGRDPAWFVEIAAVAVNVGLFERLLTKASILLADERLVTCPSPNSASILVEFADPSTLASRLGVVFQIHPAYMADSESANAVRTKLREVGVLVNRRDEPVDAFQLLARHADYSNGTPLRITDGDIIAVRDAWARLTLDQRKMLGPKIGESVAVRTISYEPSGKIDRSWQRPCEAYLPLAIDRESNGFAKAAGKTPGLLWIDPAYANVLKTKRDPAEVGSQRLFVAFGAAREPRLVKPPNLQLPGKRDSRMGSALANSPCPKRQSEAVTAVTYASHLLDDHWSPDLDSVVLDIRSAPAKLRVRRALALLSVLSRNWERRYAEFTLATAAYRADGRWYETGSVVATWLGRLSEAAWLPNRNNVLKPPADLLLPSKTRAEGNRKDRSSLLAANVEANVFRSGILAALGLRSGPSAADLIERLRGAQAQPVTKSLIQNVHAIYLELAGTLSDGEDAGGPRMTIAQLRSAFDASPTKRGLLLANGQWHAPETVLRGPAVFGSLGTFAPNIQGLEVLWDALRVPEPSLDDCIGTLRKLADLKPSAEREGIMVATLRAMATKLRNASPQSRKRLKRLPVWTDEGWFRERPVYLADASIASSVATDLRIWKPGLTSSAELDPLVEALDVTRLRLLDFAPRFSAENVADGEWDRQLFVATVALLGDSLARDDIRLHDSLSTTWDELYRARFIIDPELEICHELANGRVLTVPAGAHVTAEPLLFVARSLERAGLASSGGEAIASLFTGDRQKVAWAWAACWSQAAAGERANAIALPETRPETATKSRERLTGLMHDARSRPRKGTAGAIGHTSNGTPPASTVRKLRDVGRLLPDEGTIVNAGATTRRIVFANQARSDSAGRAYSGSTAGVKLSAERAVLPSSGVREDLALDAVRRALRRNPQEICDMRNRRRLGVDAVDELRQCYEIKMSSSAALPQEVTLTASEVYAAQTDPDFFLAIVTGLEEGEGELRVRFIFDPLKTLSVKFKGDLTLTGVPEAEALEFRFAREADDN